MAYSDKVLDHYENPRNVGKMDAESGEVGTGMVGAPACGDVMRLQIKVGEDGIIQDAKFKTYGCGSAIASSSLLTEWVKGRTLDEAEVKTWRVWIILMISWTSLTPSWLHVVILVWKFVWSKSSWRKSV
jgi:NifU-like protein involved in Fe-S cluster formation